ncbi:hypothetical protein Sjap_000349 [Stephania japonica]|uniref:Uncharacterized protein n=1 Tax=Stephania japonica TaxID=461633 RepID=A0AAP0KJP2_9MAGN
MLYVWLLCALEPQVATSVTGKSIETRPKTAHDLRKSIENLYCFNNRAQIQYNRTALRTTTKRSSKMIDYLRKMKGYADNLATVGDFVIESELVSCTLSGLDI